MKKLSAILAILLMILLTITPIATAEEADEFDESEALETIRDMFSEDEVVQEGRYSGELMQNSDLPGEWTNILLLGTDNRSRSFGGLTDSMIILSINNQTHKVKMTSVMRDTWVDIYGKGSAKLNAANVYGGPNLAVRTINENFGMNIDKYVVVNFHGLSKIIDQLGGVDVVITSGERKYMNLYLAEYREWFGSSGAGSVGASGLVHLTGAQATAYARIRNIGSDYQRTERQRTVLVAMAQTLKDSGTQNIIGILPELLTHVETNLGAADIISLLPVLMQVDLDDEDSIVQYRIPVDGTFASGMFGTTWAIKPDFDQNTQMLYEFIYE